MIKVIGLVGKKHSGKDSVCNEMLRLSAGLRTIYPVYRIAFADEVKQEVADIFSTTIETINKNKLHPTVRNALQFHGTDYRRNQCATYWIDIVKYKLDLFKKDCIIVFTDVRFQDEADYIKSIDGKLIRIRRNSTDTIEDNHPTETNIDKIKCDNLIINDWSLERLGKMTEDLLNQYKLIS